MNFGPVPWDEPLDALDALHRIRPRATIAGVFTGPMARVAAQYGIRLPRPWSAYRLQGQYPLREHVTLLIDVTRTLFPDVSLRRGLYKMGKAAVEPYLESMLGKVTVGATEDPELVLRATGQSYGINLPGSSVTVEAFQRGECRVSLQHVPYFLDSHHVGLFEQMLRRCGLRTETDIAMLGDDSAMYRIRW